MSQVYYRKTNGQVIRRSRKDIERECGSVEEYAARPDVLSLCVAGSFQVAEVLLTALEAAGRKVSAYTLAEVLQNKHDPLTKDRYDYSSGVPAAVSNRRRSLSGLDGDF